MIGSFGKIFHSRSPKTALNDILFTFLSDWITSGLRFILEEFMKNNCVKELCKKSFENKLHTINILHITYTHKRIISGFIKTLRIKLLPLSVAMVVGPMFYNKVMDWSEASTQFTVNKRNQLEGLILDYFYFFFKSELVQLDICGHTKLFMIILEGSTSIAISVRSL